MSAETLTVSAVPVGVSTEALTVAADAFTTPPETITISVGPPTVSLETPTLSSAALTVPVETLTGTTETLARCAVAPAVSAETFTVSGLPRGVDGPRAGSSKEVSRSFAKVAKID